MKTSNMHAQNAIPSFDIIIIIIIIIIINENQLCYELCRLSTYFRIGIYSKRKETWSQDSFPENAQIQLGLVILYRISKY